MLNIELPISAFASIAPLILVALHFDLLHNLGEHRDKLIDWYDCWSNVNLNYTPIRSTDMPQQLYPFLFDFAWIHANCIISKNIRTHFLPGLCWLLYCWAPFTVLAVIFIRFADLQHYIYTGWHILLWTIDALILRVYWPGFSKNPQKMQKPSYWKKTFLGIITMPLWVVPWILFCIVCLFLNIIKSSKGLQFSFWLKQHGVFGQLFLLSLTNIAVFWTLFFFVQIQMHIDLDSSHEYLDWVNKLENTNHEMLGLHFFPRLNVEKFISKSELNLSERRLAYASFRESRISNSIFYKAKLQGADFSDAKLQNTNFKDAKLQNSIFLSSELQCADFNSANLQSSDLKFASIQGADISFANLQGANLSGAELQAANLSQTWLQGANLSKAELQAANLEKTDLQGAILDNTQLQGANLESAKLKGAILIHTQLNRITGLEEKQLKSSWLKKLDWQKQYDFSQLTNKTLIPCSGKRLQSINSQLNNIQKQKPSKQNPLVFNDVKNDVKIFTKEWSYLLCQEPITNSRSFIDKTNDILLSTLKKVMNNPYSMVDIGQVKKYLNTTKGCTQKQIDSLN